MTNRGTSDNTSPMAPVPLNSGRIKPKGLSLVSFNCRSLRTNIVEIRDFVKNREPDILLLQETWLKPTILKGLSIHSFSLVRNDRPCETFCHAKGGTAIYFRKSLHCSPIPTPPLANMEATVCRIAMTGHRSLTIASVYIAAGTPPLRSDFEALLSLGRSVILFGDFNCKHTDWTCVETNPNGRKLLRITEELGLDVLCPYSPTHYPDIVDHRPDVLDFALVKDVALNLGAIETLDDLGSDHRPVSLTFGPQAPPGSKNTQTKTFTNWEGFKSTLASAVDAPDSPYASYSPDYFDSAEKIDDAVNSLTSLVQSAVKDNSRVAKAKLPRPPADIRNLIKAKNATLRRAALYPTPDLRLAANRAQRALRSRLSEWRNEVWNDLMREIKPSHVAYYRVARALRIDAPQHTPPLSRPDGSVAFEDEEKAECFADSIASQCSVSTQECDPAHIRAVEEDLLARSSRPLTDPDPPPPPISTDEIQSYIKGLKPRKAPGADGISNKALKYFPIQVLTLLALIFNACFDQCYFPAGWKEAIVIGIPKPGKPLNLPTSHRPISLLKAMGKLFEKVILARMREHLFGNDLIINEQFGFRRKHSCPQQVHRIVEFILSGFHTPSKRKTVAVFFDVAKAFDKVWHDGLVYKLYQLDMPDRLVRLIRSYLTNRAFRFRHEGTLSSPRPIKAGVPQGSALSPLLYSSYTNDIPNPTPGTELSLFADDTALYRSGLNPDAIVNRLQPACDALGAWFRKWRIEVNPDKSVAVLFDAKRRSRVVPYGTKSLRMLGVSIPWQRTVKYLGVTLDKNLTFRPHINVVSKKARFYMYRLNPMIGNNSRMSLRNKRTLFKVCIRPTMTYSSPVFSHIAPSALHKLQVIQNIFSRKATGAPWYVRNADLHRDLKLPTMQQHLRTVAERFFEASENHSNPLIQKAVDYSPEPPSIPHFRRPKHVLTDPPNQLSCDLDRLIEAQDT